MNAALALWMVVAPAVAQNRQGPIDVERFKPALTHDPFVVTEGADVRWPPRYDPLQLGVAVNGAFNPLVVVQDGAIVRRFVSQRAGLDLFGSFTVAQGVAVAVGLPLFALQDGDGNPNAAGIGDLRVVPKFRLADDRRGLGLALLTELRLPTHSDEEFSGGANQVQFAPKLALDHRFPLGLRFGVNAGLLFRQATQFRNIRAGSEVTYSAALAWHLGGYDGRVALGVDVHGGVGLTDLDFEELPLEGQLYAQLQPSDEITLQAGPAIGILAGFGTPTLRLYAGIRWSPTAHDDDGDGIPNDKDRCPQQPETRNGIDDWDGCPEDAASLAFVRVRVVDPDGKPIRRSGVRVDDDRADNADEPGTYAVQVEPGRHVLWVRGKGYVPKRIDLRVRPGQTVERTVTLQPVRVTVTDNRLEFAGTVYFDFDSANLVPESHDLLDEVALVLEGNPQIRRLRVEGHTDKVGPADYNRQLSHPARSR